MRAEPVGKYLSLMGEPTQMGPSCPCTSTPGRGPRPPHGDFGTPRTHQSTVWEKAAIMSSLVSCRERRTQSWQQEPPVSSPFCLSPTWIQAPLGALCCPNTFPVSIFHQRRKEQCLELGITTRSILGGI